MDPSELPDQARGNSQMKKPNVKKTVALPDLGKYPVQHGPETPSRMAIILWGPPGDGKTTWAATAPGVKLWLSFGDNEHLPVSDREDVHVVNLAGLGFEDLFKETAGDNPFNLDRYLAENEVIETVVIDSLTAIEYKGLQRAVANKVGASNRFTPTMEAPGMSAYGGRNANVIEAMSGLLKVTAKHNVHVIFTAHEADPTLDKEGNIQYIAIALGGKIVNNMSWRLSEVWHFMQQRSGNRDRQLTVRAYGQRKPMKTRMFDQKGDAQFVIQYDPDKPDDAPGQHTIAGFYRQWIDNGKRRIPPPKKAK